MFPKKPKKDQGSYSPSVGLKGLSSKEAMPSPVKKKVKKSFAAAMLKKNC